jgi:hypothetical protein
MGNESYVDIVGIGDICVESNTGCALTLKNVQHVPNIRLNLIFIHALDEECYENYLGNGKQKLVKG